MATLGANSSDARRGMTSPRPKGRGTLTMAFPVAFTDLVSKQKMLKTRHVVTLESTVTANSKKTAASTIMTYLRKTALGQNPTIRKLHCPTLRFGVSQVLESCASTSSPHLSHLSSHNLMGVIRVGLRPSPLNQPTPLHSHRNPAISLVSPLEHLTSNRSLIV